MSLLPKLTFLFLLFSVLVWIATNYINSTCQHIVEDVKGSPSDAIHVETHLEHVTPDTPLKDSKARDALEWLRSALPPDIARFTTSCPPVTATTDDASVTMVALGEINLNSSATQWTTLSSSIHSSILQHILGDFQAMVSSLICPPNQQDAINMKNDLKLFSDLGLSVVSLANHHTLEVKETITSATIHSLEAAGIKWIGLNAKKHEIIQVKNMKIGIIGFCGVHGHCIESNSIPFAPVKYFVKSARESVTELKQHGVDNIVILLHWGKEQSRFPDETVLYIARHLSELEDVSVILGHHSQHVQDHAYFGKTLVLFSPGNFAISDNSSTLCWKRTSDHQWEYYQKESCLLVHPGLRHSLLEHELQTRIYKIKLRKSLPATAEYITLPLVTNDKLMRYPDVHANSKWIAVCGGRDSHCLSCKPF